MKSMPKPSQRHVAEVSNQYLGYTVKNVKVNNNDTFITNEPAKRKRVLTDIKHALLEATSLRAAVAFVTKSGIISLYQALKDFTERGGKAQIVASDYLTFTQPEALELLLTIPNVEVKLLQNVNYHGKLYIFENSLKQTKVIVGSSNLTQSALSTNAEMNFMFSDGDERVTEATIEFAKIWQNASELNSSTLSQYVSRYELARKTNTQNVIQVKAFTPNELQKTALANLAQARKMGKRRGLVVSATGTGKTVLSAFDVRQFQAKRALFLVHRTTIARKSMETYRTILKDQYSFGLVGGGEDQWSEDFVFGTVQTLARPENLNRFASDHFDYIVIDETHRAAAESYQKVIEYFSPKFLLGMTATPERSDNQNIFEVFDNNIVCDIRLQDALDTDILCPFHYFGIAELTTADEQTATINELNHTERFAHMLTQSQKLGADTSTIKALCFVSRIEEAQAFEQYLQSQNIPAKSLSGKDSESTKQQAIEALEAGELQYVITVDIFNEGVDIPSINQILMARPTQSAIVFVQQLGRGLRKHVDKEYLTVIDIVGNYDNNFLIPIALYGDRTRNKDNLRRLLRSEETLLPGASTIAFDRIAKERIFKAIQTSPKIGIRELKNEYQLIRAKTGTSPTMMSIREHGDISPYLFTQQAKINSLHEFARKYDAEYAVSAGEFLMLGVLIKAILDGKQVFEAIALRSLLQKSHLDYPSLRKDCQHSLGIDLTPRKYLAVLNLLSLHYENPELSKQYQMIETSQGDDDELPVAKSGHAISTLNQSQIYLLEDAIENALAEYQSLLKIGRICDGFVVGAKYTYKETFKILDWDKNPNPQNIGGYFYNRTTMDCAIFINYNKQEDIAASTQYHDYFVDRQRFHWTSKNRRSLNSPEIKALLDQAKNNLRVPLFIRKEAKSEGSARYYVGEMTVIPNTAKETSVGGLKAVSLEFMLDEPVPMQLYRHLVDNV